MSSQPWKRHLGTTGWEHPHLSESRSMASMARRWFIATPSNALAKRHSFTGGRSLEARSYLYPGQKPSSPVPRSNCWCWFANQGWTDGCPTTHVMIRIHGTRQVQGKCERRRMSMDGNGDGRDGRTRQGDHARKNGWTYAPPFQQVRGRNTHGTIFHPRISMHTFLLARTASWWSQPRGSRVQIRPPLATSLAVYHTPSVLLSRHHRRPRGSDHPVGSLRGSLVDQLIG